MRLIRAVEAGAIFVSASIFSTIETWLNESGASELGKWSSTFLAHAGGPTSRMALADYNVTADRISVSAVQRPPTG